MLETLEDKNIVIWDFFIQLDLVKVWELKLVHAEYEMFMYLFVSFNIIFIVFYETRFLQHKVPTSSKIQF